MLPLIALAAAGYTAYYYYTENEENKQRYEKEQRAHKRTKKKYDDAVAAHMEELNALDLSLREKTKIAEAIQEAFSSKEATLAETEQALREAEEKLSAAGESSDQMEKDLKAANSKIKSLEGTIKDKDAKHHCFKDRVFKRSSKLIKQDVVFDTCVFLDYNYQELMDLKDLLKTKNRRMLAVNHVCLELANILKDMRRKNLHQAAADALLFITEAEISKIRSESYTAIIHKRGKEYGNRINDYIIEESVARRVIDNGAKVTLVTNDKLMGYYAETRIASNNAQRKIKDELISERLAVLNKQQFVDCLQKLTGV